MNILGIDIGGSGIKGAPVDTETGQLLEDRLRIETPQPSHPDAVAAVVKELVTRFGWQQKPLGITLPTPVRKGVVVAAANIDPGWVGISVEQYFAKACDCNVSVWNDADAAGIAEMKFGAGRGKPGVVVIVTLGTGIGTALFNDQCLVPNSELGHIEIDGRDAEELAAARVRKAQDLSWKQWSRNVDRYLQRLEFYLHPDLFIIGGGVSKKSEKFLPHLTVSAPVVAAVLQNNAGIVGAAMGHHLHMIADGT